MKTKHFRKTLKSGLHVLLWQEEKWYVVKCLEVEVASQGKTRKEALKNIEEAVELYFEDEKVNAPNVFQKLELLSFPLRINYV